MSSDDGFWNFPGPPPIPPPPPTTLPDHAPVSDGNDNFGTLKVAGLDLGPSGHETAITATGADFNYLSGVVPGTSAASLAVVLDGNKWIDQVSTGALHLGASGSTTLVQATAAEINVLHGVTPGTLAANSAVVVDATGAINVLKIADIIATGGTVDNTAIGTTTPDQVTTNYLQVDTGSKTATANVLGDVTLNKMAGVITTGSLTTAAGATFTLSLTNSDIASGDQVFASVQYGSATTGTPMIATVTAGNGFAIILVQNIHATAAFNGSLQIAFLVVKN